MTLRLGTAFEIEVQISGAISKALNRQLGIQPGGLEPRRIPNVVLELSPIQEASMRFITTTTIALLTLAGAGVSGEEARTNLGTVTCSTMPSSPQSERSSAATANLQCAFKASGSSHEELYTGTIAEVGSQKPIQGKVVLVWAVMGPRSDKLAPGLLTQRYVTRAAGAGQDSDGPRLLVGQSNADIMLQQVTNEPEGEPPVLVIDLKLSLTPA
jgi:Protein of unknown function (DUF992)